jgi:predicted AAA+ superfamily ATPase
MQQIQRDIQPLIEQALQKYPIVALTGPRQSGKTTLCKILRPNYAYVNLEDLSMRGFALEDPKGFLETYKSGVIIDEIQYVPDLFSYLQVYTDERQQNGEYLITGSQNFLMMERISQSLAGRVALFNLLPLSITELRTSSLLPENWEETIFHGGYPRKWIQKIESADFYENYLRTYVERDVRLIKNINNLDLFQKFIQLLAGRVGQQFNQLSLGNELGIDNKTVNAWMNLLEVSFIAFRLQPYYQNFGKRVVKTPKVYFYDTGLLAFLLGIRSANQIQLHFAKGALFENFAIVERTKYAWNFKSQEKFFYWRDVTGNELDLIIERGLNLIAVEIKAGKTINNDFFKGLQMFSKMARLAQTILIYGGNQSQERSETKVLGVYDLHSF